MNNKILIIIVLMVLSNTGHQLQAFERNNSSTDRRLFEFEKMHPDDRFILTLFTDLWQNVLQNMNLKAIQRGINISALPK